MEGHSYHAPLKFIYFLLLKFRDVLIHINVFYDNINMKLPTSKYRSVCYLPDNIRKKCVFLMPRLTWNFNCQNHFSFSEIGPKALN